MTVALYPPQKVDIQAIPPLEAGDRLTHEEFMRRYAAMPHVQKAELIEGIVYMPSPVRHRNHGRPHGMMITLFGTYFASTPGTDFSDNPTVLLDLDNDPQPDAILWLESNVGGKSLINHDGYLQGPPELVVEIAASTESYDMHNKLNAYRRNGVQEYMVWRERDGEIDWFTLTRGQYQPLPTAHDGLIRSLAFPGLWLKTSALLAGNLATALAELQRGLASPDHAAFVQRLAALRAQSA